MKKINLQYIIGDISSSDPELPSTYAEAGQNLIRESVFLQYEYELM